MTKPSIHRRPSFAAAGLVAGLCLLAGCDGGGADGDVMVLRPAETPTTAQATQTTRPAVEARPTPEPAEPAEKAEKADVLLAAAPSYINIDNEVYEFPPAKLFLKRAGDRVKVKLLSRAADDEAGEQQQSFYFEMEIDLPASSAAAAGEAVSPEELSAAEWVFNSQTSARSDSPSGIVLGSQRLLLQPADVWVSFEPLDESLVIVTLTGTFGEFDAAKPRDSERERRVSVQAVLSAETLRR